jgi:hypothetical protein
MRYALLLSLLFCGTAHAVNQSAIIHGPLRVHPQNPRYFTDDGKRAIYLTGSHTWNSLQDMFPEGRQSPFDFDGYLDTLAGHGHNFIRLWRWELFAWDETPNSGNVAKHVDVAPHPWLRKGPGNARDGKPKFDLDQFDDGYFQRLRSRVTAARDHGICVSVMLFEGWGLQHITGAWEAHPFHPDNNINGLGGDVENGTDIDTLRVPAITKVQEAYVRKAIETVGDLDNVLYEIVNEAGVYSIEWQEHFIRYVHEFEKGRPKQHPVGMTFPYSRDVKKRGSNSDLFHSSADWISPNPDAGKFSYKTNPPPSDGGKIILADTDHLWGIGGDVAWVWKSFLRGVNPLFMDPWKRDVLTKGDEKTWESVRHAMGVARRLADQVNLAAMTPQPALATTGYCLADSPREYVVYLPDGGEVTLDLPAPTGTLQATWLDPDDETTHSAASVGGGAKQTFTAPFKGHAVLILQTKE